MKIAKATCSVLRIPYTMPVRKEPFEVLANFVEIETDDGLAGQAMAAYPMKDGIRDFVNQEVAPAIVGMDPLRPEEVRAAMYWGLSYHKYFMGVWSSSASLVDIALWDIKGKAAGQPVWKLLGGARDSVPVYITFGESFYTKEELVEVAKMLVHDGHDRLKMVVGAGKKARGVYYPPTDKDIDIDAERVRAVREAIGDDACLMIDANKKLPILRHSGWPNWSKIAG
ncbi:MAG: hypothetical protein HYX90_09285 [Chloroflexi bacterium]|nr:hypothetical protein [Chloroflexota bacterium]